MEAAFSRGGLSLDEVNAMGKHWASPLSAEALAAGGI